MTGLGHIYFNGVNAITVPNYKQGEYGDVRVFTGTGTYQIDQFCRGVATISLKENGVAAGTLSISFIVSGTAASPQIQALVSNPASDFTGSGFLNKINL